MSTLAIRVENLSKSYKIGGQYAAYDTIRESLMHLIAQPLNRRGAIKEQNQNMIWALKDVSFELKHGDVIGVIGRNGAGKSTLLKILARITRPTRGNVRLRGRVGSLLEVGTGFHPELTGRENIYLNGAILGMRRVEIDHKFDEIVDFAEIEQFLDTPVKRYSSGMYMRLAFAVAAHLEPEILLVDEVLAVGDLAFQKKCLGKMGQVSEQGRTVIFVSHNMEAVINLCKRAILLDQGELLFSGETPRVVQLYMSRLLQTSNGVYRRPESAPEQAAMLTRVELSQAGATTNQFSLSKPIHLSIEYRLAHHLPEAFLGFQIRTSLGQPVFTSTSADMDREGQPVDGVFPLDSDVHRGLAQVIIPALLLNVGTYELHVSIFKPGRGLQELVKDLYFEMVDDNSFASKPFNSPRQGIILRQLPWDIIRL